MQNIIVSLTSYPARIKTIYLTIESLLNQTLKPNLIILWLSKEEFANYGKLPIELLNLEKNGLIIKYCDKNFRSFNKLIHTLKEYPNDIIITVDDDCIYDNDCIKLLYEGYLEYPDCISCHRALRILIQNDKILPYNKWIWNIKSKDTKPSYTNFFTASAGVLYPPFSLHKNVLDEKLFLELCPKEDDMWFWTMALMNLTKINVVKNNIWDTEINEEASQEFALCNTNVHCSESDRQLEKIIKHYPLIYRIIKENYVIKTNIVILSILPLIRIIKTNTNFKLKLFSFIPLFKRKIINNKLEIKIFGFKILSINKL